MLNVTKDYVTVFNPRIDLSISEIIVFARLSTSKKVKSPDGLVNYINMTWNAKFVGEAFEPAKALRKGDKIDILNGIIENRYDKVKQLAYFDVTVFEFVMSKRGGKNMTSQKSIFSAEQQDVINRAIEGEDLSAYKKDDLSDYLDHIAATSDDADVVTIYMGTRDKVDTLSPEDWEAELAIMPYKVSFSGDSRQFDGEGE